MAGDFEQGNVYLVVQKEINLFPSSTNNHAVADGSGTASQDGRLGFGFPMMSLEIFIGIYLPAAI